MAIKIEYHEAFFMFLFFVPLFYLQRQIRNRRAAPTNWPVLGMLPRLVTNAHRVHDFATDVLKESGGTFEFKGPWFSNSDMVATVDPANIHHIMSKNFSNYPKGDEFREKFEIIGEGIFGVDDKLWEIHRKTTMSLMNNESFYKLLEQAMWSKIEKGLLPFLEHFSERESEFDLEDVFQRFAFDSISKLLLDHDPGSLAIDLPYVPCKNAFNDALEALLYRHVLPESVWKFQKRLQIGDEKKLSEAWRAIDEFMYPCIAINDKDSTGFLKEFDGVSREFSDSKKFMRDTFLSLFFAGTDTTSTALSWFFWLLAENPYAEAKILEEIRTELNLKGDEKWRFFSAEESRKLVYLHAALCESLRLFPPVALEHKTSAKSDVFPSGHRIDPNTKIVISLYSMGRMESIWGNDCLKFKPERWITERGGIKHEPSFKFTAFMAGPRTCIGKEMAFIQMKMVAASIIYNYIVRVVEGHLVVPRASIIIHMKHGLKVKLSKRNLS